MFPSKITGLYIDRQTGEPVVLLQEEAGGTQVPIWIRFNEMLALALELSDTGKRPPRPFSHDLIQTVLRNIDAKVRQVIISDIQEHIYRARVFFETNNSIVEIDARPSDALVLALKSKAPVFVSEDVVQKQAQLLEAAGQTDATLRERLQRFRPEDFTNLSIG